ncbi:arginase family protein, partial [Staphylococcus equorum]
LKAVAKHNEVIGFDLVEVAPMYDQTGMTGQTAARVMLDLLSYVLKERELKGDK